MSVYDFCALNLSISGYYNCLDLRYVKSPRKLTACLWESQGPRLYHSKFPLYKLCLLNPMFIPLPRPTGSFGNVGKTSSTCSSLIYPLARCSREDARTTLKRPYSILTRARCPRRRGLGVTPEAFYLDIPGSCDLRGSGMFSFLRVAFAFCSSSSAASEEPVPFAQKTWALDI